MENNRIIISINKKPPLVDFEKLCNTACGFMNDKALRQPEFYLDKGGTKLEPEVLAALNKAAKDTVFDGTIKLVSGAEFPDIVADKYYGVEVKSTKSNKWSVIGSSILESTRIEDVETIFFMFGKLCNPVQFKTRRYQDCLKSIKVTHSPRYEIDMDLPEGETIFDRMGIDYDSLRQNPNPIQPVVDYYKRHLLPGEALWWVNGSDEEAAAPDKLKMWRLLSAEDKDFYRALGLALFPEIYGSASTKFENFTMWLIIHYGVVSKSLRDIFTAGGQVEIKYENKSDKFPQIYAKLINQKDDVIGILSRMPSDTLSETWQMPVYHSIGDRLQQWIQLVVRNSSFTPQKVESLLKYYFLSH